MQDEKSRQERLAFHPFLFAVYPLLALWATNVTQIRPYAVTRALFITLIVLAAALITSLALYRQWSRAAVFASLLLVLFFSYGQVFARVDMLTAFGFLVGRHRFMILVWIGLLLAGGIALWRYRQPPHALNRILNVVSLFLVILAAGQIAIYQVRAGFPMLKARAQTSANPAPAQAANAADGPDVYYIILDAYTREDVMRELGGPDVSGFLQALREMGFYVAECSQSNYDQTSLSISSSLNMQYLDALKVPVHPDNHGVNFDDLTDLFYHSAVRQEFEKLGYQFVSFKTVYPWLDITDSDYYYDSEEAIPYYDKLETVNFQYLFLNTTFLRTMLEVQAAQPRITDRMPLFLVQLFYPKAGMLSTREYKQYEQNLYVLDRLSQAPGLPGKKFVYAHLFITHQPYVFNPDGSFRWPPFDDIQAYFAQIEYANRRMPEVLQTIIQDSATPPVIILQSDHGYPYTTVRPRILNAYYLPGGQDQDLYPAITPVNSFRYVFDHYFGGSYLLLPDATYHSPHDHPYRFEPVGPSCP